MSRFTRRVVLAWLALMPAFFGREGGAAAPASQRYLCTQQDCDPYIYDPATGDPDNINGDHPIPPHTAFADLPKDWLCPVCGSPKSFFVPIR